MDTLEFVSILVLSAFLLGGLLAIFRRRADWLLWQLAAALCLGGFNAYFLTIFFPIKVTTACCVIYLIVHMPDWRARIRRSGDKLLLPVALSFLASLLAAYVIGAGGVDIRSGGLQNPAARPLVQAYSYWTTLALFPFVLCAIDAREKLRSFYNAYLAAAVATCFVGFYQLYTIQTDRPFMPIIRIHGEHSVIAKAEIAGRVFLRLYAFAGEPKTLAVFLLPALLATLAGVLVMRGAWRPRWSRAWVLLLISVVFVFTFSTAGLLALAAGIAFIVSTAGLLRHVSLLRLAVFLAVGVIALQATFERLSRSDPLFGDDTLTISRVLYTRAVERVDDEIQTRPEYEVIGYIFRERPEALFFGLGLGMYNFHVEGLTWRLGVTMLDSGWTTHWADTGFVGAIVAALWLGAILLRGLREVLRPNPYDPEGRGFLVMSLAAFVGAIAIYAGTNAFPSVVLFAAVAESSRLLVRRPVEVEAPAEWLESLEAAEEPVPCAE